MASHIEKGQAGEEVACRLLESKGYTILERNWRYRHKEVDIIASNEREVVIVEVKTRAMDSLVAPRESVLYDKIHNLVLAADHYIKQHSLLLPVRFDIIAVETELDGTFTTEHIEHAFVAPLMSRRPYPKKRR
ncbi:YraN family protein [Porphyromonas pogonae]|uniref:YraN family protein n=1 Tax=Porphyromonas pogonae TaxID=867595 RepID=UPI002E78A620|nr:YraN family protein [Porphyromonas pogonae]